MNKKDYIAKYGKAAYAKMQSQRDVWQKAHPEEMAASNKAWYEAHLNEAAASHKAWRDAHPEVAAALDREKSRKGGKGYERHLQYKQTGIPGEKENIRKKHCRQYQPYKHIIDPQGLSQIHHEWLPGTPEYTGVALVEKDQHMHGFVDVIEILEGKITLLTEAEVAGKRRDQ